MVIALINRLLPSKTPTHITQWEQLTHWWRAHLLPNGLMPFSGLTGQQISLEASAAMLPGLYRWGFNAEAQHMVDGLISQQQAAGHWQQNLWLTGQCLLALMADMQQSLITGRSFRSSVERGFLQGCDWVYEQIHANGQMQAVTINTWPGDKQTTPDAVALLALVPLAWAAKVANRPQYRLAVDRALRCYLLDQKTGFTMYSPYYAQFLWALDQLGQSSTADKLLLDMPLTTRGEIPAYANSHVVHVPALLLWSQVYYRLGHNAMGKHLFERALSYQQPRSGAFPELSQRGRDLPLLGVAWYLTALDDYLIKSRENTASLLPDTIDTADSRLTWLCEQLAQCGHILEVQSGKGRFNKALQHNQVGQQWFVTEPSGQVIQNLRFPIHGREGKWQQLPYPDASFDAVFGVDSLSHSVYLIGALREAARVLKPNGLFVIVEQVSDTSSANPWRIKLTLAQWQDALMQAGLSVRKTDILPDGSMALVACRP